jgi:hypothetical protein
MPRIFTNAEYADMLYVCGCWDDRPTAAAEEYGRRFPMRRIPDRRISSNVSMHCVKVIRYPVLMFQLTDHVNKMRRNGKTFLKCYSVALLLEWERFLHVSVFHEQVCGTHCLDMACTYFTHSVCKIYTQQTLPCVCNVVISYILITNCFH